MDKCSHMRYYYASAQNLVHYNIAQASRYYVWYNCKYFNIIVPLAVRIEINLTDARTRAAIKSWNSLRFAYRRFATLWYTQNAPFSMLISSGIPVFHKGKYSLTHTRSHLMGALNPHACVHIWFFVHSFFVLCVPHVRDDCKYFCGQMELFAAP